VMLCLAIPWPHQDGKWSGILAPQEALGTGMAIAAWLIATYVTPLIWRF
jgi:hypothetical protein